MNIELQLDVDPKSNLELAVSTLGFAQTCTDVDEIKTLIRDAQKLILANLNEGFDD